MKKLILFLLLYLPLIAQEKKDTTKPAFKIMVIDEKCSKCKKLATNSTAGIWYCRRHYKNL